MSRANIPIGVEVHPPAERPDATLDVGLRIAVSQEDLIALALSPHRKLQFTIDGTLVQLCSSPHRPATTGSLRSAPTAHGDTKRLGVLAASTADPGHDLEYLLDNNGLPVAPRARAALSMLKVTER